MRTYYKQILKTFFHARLTAVYNSTDATQAEMALLLSMDLRSFVDLAQGKSGCSALTFARFLIYFCPDRMAFLDDLQAAFEAEAPVGSDFFLTRIHEEHPHRKPHPPRKPAAPPETQRFCPHCGTALHQAAQANCPVCGQRSEWHAQNETA